VVAPFLFNGSFPAHMTHLSNYRSSASIVEGCFFGGGITIKFIHNRPLDKIYLGIKVKIL